MIELLGLPSLDGLVDFRSRQSPNLVSHVLDLSPRQIGRRTVGTVLLLAYQLLLFLHFRQHRWRPLTTARLDFRRHGGVLPRQRKLAHNGRTLPTKHEYRH
ncbi:MAG: hypothetical protein AAF961_19770 [Planctomycetota bacterium]